ncbi:MAG: DMT family transporter [Rickettsiales bacterium]|nr:DMT family transporter [Rickettsiales bacterium]
MNATFVGIIAPLSWSLLPLITFNLKHLDPFLILVYSFLIFNIIEFLRQALTKSIINPLTIPNSYYLNGLIGVFGFHLCYFLALRMAPIMPVYLIVNTTSIFIIFYSKLFNNLDIRPNHIFACLINFSAVGLIASSKASEAFELKHLFGYFLALLAANAWAIYSVKNKLFDVPLRATNYPIFLSAILSLFAYIFYIEEIDFSFSVNDFYLLLLLGLFPIGYSFYMWIYGITNGDIRLLSIIAFINPVFGTIWLTIAGIEEFNWVLVISIILIISGTFIARSK